MLTHRPPPTDEFGGDEGYQGGESNLLRVDEDLELSDQPIPGDEEVVSADDQVGQRQAEEADVDPLAEPLPEEHGHVESVAHHTTGRQTDKDREEWELTEDTHRETDRQRQTDRDSRQTDRQTDRQRDSQTHR